MHGLATVQHTVYMFDVAMIPAAYYAEYIACSPAQAWRKPSTPASTSVSGTCRSAVRLSFLTLWCDWLGPAPGAHAAARPPDLP